MKCSNKSIIKIIPVLYFLIVAALFVSNFINYSHLAINPLHSKSFFIIPSVFLISAFVYFYHNAQYFEFDSAGEVLIFINRGTFLSSFFHYREIRAEFPKSKLRFFDVKDYYFFRILEIYITSENNRTRRLKFNVTFLNYKKQRLLLESLSEVSKKNKVSFNGN